MISGALACALPDGRFTMTVVIGGWRNLVRVQNGRATVTVRPDARCNLGLGRELPGRTLDDHSACPSRQGGGS